LLAMKLNSAPNRDKENKRIKGSNWFKKSDREIY